MTQNTKSKNSCSTCGKPIVGQRRGSLTAWIFAGPVCGCKPAAKPTIQPARLSQPPKDALSDDLVGRIIAERYEVKELIGRGGMGCVYRLEERDSKEPYAMKTLDAAAVSIGSWMRLEKEARAAGKLDHPGLLKVYTSGLIDDVRPYFVMEYIEGETLADYIKRNGPMPLDDALPLFINICFALGYAHQKEVIHRDLKPSNIMLFQEEPGKPLSIKIVDFGIAKFASAEEAESLALTSTGEVFGTPYYMSPEQCIGAAVDYRSDIYSLGCVMYEALTGQPPFLGESALALMMQHQSKTPLSLKEASLGTEFPEALEQVITTVLHKEPEQRYANLSDLAMDLGRVKSGQPIKLKGTLSSVKSTGLPIMVIASGALFAGLCLGVLLGAWWAPHDSGKGIARPLENGVVRAFAESKEESETMPYCDEFILEGKKTFKFPEKAVGTLTVYSREGKKIRPARGEITVPAGSSLSFAVEGGVVVARPQIIIRFNKDDLKELDLSAPSLNSGEHSDLCDPLALYISRLQSLHTLGLRNLNISDRGLQFINDLPELENLDVSSTSTTEKGILQLKRLRSFEALSVGPLTSAHELVQMLPSCKSLISLSLTDCHLNSRDILPLLGMSQLQQLELTGNSEIADADVEKLLGLKHLTHLGVAQTGVTGKIFQMLKAFPRLKSVYLPKGVGTQEQLKDLHDRGVRIVVSKFTGNELDQALKQDEKE